MDSFSTIAIFSKSEDIISQTPVDEEGGGGSSGGYCVVARVEADTSANVDQEGGGGSSGGYCVIA